VESNPVTLYVVTLYVGWDMGSDVQKKSRRSSLYRNIGFHDTHLAYYFDTNVVNRNSLSWIMCIGLSIIYAEPTDFDIQ